MTASFRMNQGTTGTYGLARQDLTTGSVTLEAEYTTHSSYLWEITSEPEGSTSSISGSGSSVLLNLTITGGYLIRLTVDATLPTEDVLELYAGVPLVASGLCIPAFNETIQDNSESSTSKYGYERKLTRFLKWVDNSLVSSGSFWSRVSGSPNYVYPTTAYDQIRLGDVTGTSWFSLYSEDFSVGAINNYSALEAHSNGLMISTGNSITPDFTDIDDICLFTHSNTAAYVKFDYFPGQYVQISHNRLSGSASISISSESYDLVSTSSATINSSSAVDSYVGMSSVGREDGAISQVGMQASGQGDCEVYISSDCFVTTYSSTSLIRFLADNESASTAVNSIIQFDCTSTNGSTLIELGSNNLDEVRFSVKEYPAFFSWYSSNVERLRLDYTSGGGLYLWTQNLDSVDYLFYVWHHQENGSPPSIMVIESSSSATSVGTELCLYATTVVDNYSIVEIKSTGHLPYVDIIAEGISSSGAGGITISSDVPDNASTILMEAYSDIDIAAISIEAISDSSSATLTLKANGVGTPPTGGGNIVIGDALTHVVRFEDMNMDDSTTWLQTYIYFSSADTEWDTFYTNFGYASIIDAINQAATMGGGGGTSYWARTGTVLSPDTAGDTIRVGAGSAADVGLGFEGTANTGFYQRDTNELGLAINGSTDSFFGFSEPGGTYGDRPSLMGEEPIGVVSYSMSSTNLGAGDLLLAAQRATTDLGNSNVTVYSVNTNTTYGYGGSTILIMSAAYEDGAVITIGSNVMATASASVVAQTEITAYNEASNNYTDAIVSIHAQAVNAGDGYVLLGDADTDVVGFSDVYFDTASLGWTDSYLSLSRDTTDWVDWDEHLGSLTSLVRAICYAFKGIIYNPTGITALTTTSNVLAVNAAYGNVFNVTVSENITSITFSNMTGAYGNAYYGRYIKLRFVFGGSYTITLSGVSGGLFVSGESDISGTSGDVYIMHIDETGSSKRYCRIEGPYSA